MNPLLSLILPVVALILALILAAAVWYWWSSGQPEEEPDQKTQAGTGQTAASGFSARLAGLWAGTRRRLGTLSQSTGALIQARQAAATPNAEMIEVLRLHRDLSDGGLVIEIGGRKYYSLDQMSDPQVKRRFLGNAEAMAQFARLKKGTSPLIDWSAPVEPPPEAATSAPPVTPSPAPAQSIPRQQQAETPKPKGMSDEIEEMLQYRLTLDPAFGRRSIHIRSAEDGSIYVEVDGKTFDGVSEVDDADVRSFLQNIIREWESGK